MGEVRQCPLCRTPRRFVACPVLDRLVADLPAACAYECGAAGLTVATVVAHEAICTARPVPCKFREYDCAWMGRALDAPAHEAACPRWPAEFRARTERRYRAEYDRVREMLTEHMNTVLDAVAAVIPHGIMSLPGVSLSVPALGARAVFAAASGRRFELRPDALARDTGLAPLRQAYGCVVAHDPTAEGDGAAGDGFGFMARMTVIIIDPERGVVVGVGSAQGSFPGDRIATIPVVFAGALVHPPPWTAYVAVDTVLPRTDHMICH